MGVDIKNLQQQHPKDLPTIDNQSNIPTVDSEGHIVDINGPSIEVKTKSHKPQKSKVNLTSCFGKPKSDDLHARVENENVSVNNDLKVNEGHKIQVQTKEPQLQGEATLNSEDRSIVK